jgi:hypothetical protein
MRRPGFADLLNPGVAAMNKLRLALVAAMLIAASVSSASETASANSSSADTPVAPSAARGRHVDVRSACKDFDDEMQSVLAPVMRESGILDDVIVEFDLEGTQVSNVHTSHGPFTYQRAVRHAVYRLTCDAGDEAPHTMSLVVHFVGWRGAAALYIRAGQSDANSIFMARATSSAKWCSSA